MQVFITILGLTVPSYGLCIAAGMITANLAAFVLIRRRRMDGNDFIILEAYTILGAFLGAKLPLGFPNAYRLEPYGGSGVF